jgi:glycerophosphoryl diester phosphodiesterase
VSLLTTPDARLVIGHRGSAAHAPENTLESFTQAIAAGADALELDVHLTRDGAVVVHHDATVDRTTSGSGAVAALTLAEVAALDAGARFTRDGGRSFPYRDRGVRIPTLEAVLFAFPHVPIVVEVKAAAASRAVRALVERHDAVGRTLVASFDERALEPFRGSPFSLGATQREVAALLRAALTGRPIAPPGYAAISVPPRYRGLPLPLARFARLLRPHGRAVHVWTIDAPATAARLWAAGVSGVISNDPAAVGRGAPSGER